jgi:UDP-N-acetylmuramyl pentapeptide phosphotransferase/UDP-N-acetylglucosamine-1-phosphate transferase
VSAAAAAACVAAGTSFAAALLLVFSTSLHGRFTMDPTQGVQKFHEQPTPRVGGIAVLLGLLAALPGSHKLLLPLAAAALPAFAAGLLEDLTHRVSVKARLAATMGSSVLFSLLSGAMLTRVEVPGLDLALGFWPFALVFTALAVGGVANAFNIVDGFNGLAGGVVLVCLGALRAMAVEVDDQELAGLCLLLMAATAGFLVVNFPSGRLFLGDGGAYLLGFLVAWVAVLLPLRNPAISPWASLLACAYPILETLFSIQRKLRREGSHPGAPDRVHLHMLVHRRIARRLYAGSSRRMQNSLTSPFAWAYASLPAAWAVAFPMRTSVLVTGFALAAIAYWAVYQRLAQFRWCFSAPARRAAPVTKDA